MKKATKIYNWLSDIPPEILSNLDFDEFFLDHSKLNFKIDELEKEFDAHMMIYKFMKTLPGQSNKIQLCQTLKTKSIDASTIERIKYYEKNYPDLISIVLYKKPLQFET